MTVIETFLNRKKAPATRIPSAGSLYPPKVRRIRFRFGEPPMEHLFVTGNYPLSHFLALGSPAFVRGEDMILHAVRRVQKDVTDPKLKRRVAALVGQELVHGQEHDRFNQELFAMKSYAMANLMEFDEKTVRGKLYFGFIDLLARRGNLDVALTAALEHGTATMARRVLSSPELQALEADAEGWNLIKWHALEELEHKSIVFDLYKHLGGSEAGRIAIMSVVVVAAYPVLMLGILASLLTDLGAVRQPILVLRQTVELLRGPLGPGILTELAEFCRPGFHPDDIYTEDIVQHWQEQLFGVNGELIDRLR